MTCARNCNTDDVQLVFDSANGTFVVTVWDDQEAFIQFDQDTVPINLKRDSLGNVYAAGHNYVIRPFTIILPCSEEALALDRAWRANPMGMCGNLEIITGCCEDYDFESLRMLAPTAPNVGTEVGVYSFSFEGVVR